jgi:siroheme synthase
LIADGTTDRERRVVGTLGTIERLAVSLELDGPRLLIVGDVVGLGLAQQCEIHFESRIGL